MMLLFVGPSGSGKTTLMNMLKDPIVPLKSLTTREKRNEQDDTWYHFVTEHQFLHELATSSLLQHTKFDGHYYGTRRQEALNLTQAGKIPMLAVTEEGLIPFLHSKLFKPVIVYVSPKGRFTTRRGRERADGKRPPLSFNPDLIIHNDFDDPDGINKSFTQLCEYLEQSLQFSSFSRWRSLVLTTDS